ncbi:MAG: hypothetical protein KatS3mg033_1913 [Thermonema sp.]|uniref:hypothetical protein n=1 Tax=Thermonema sp. TaxID=2231181 RepID=UPI0021DDBF9E|nr:hypothetical protein [Thermonema sp.]GIV40113.1 MAG: hypothetical protein KatS3mg033_1913 [Thermonema sp.]
MLFKSKSPIAQLEKKVEKYFELKEEIAALHHALKELEGEIVEECTQQKLFQGKTATVGSAKVRRVERTRLQVPKRFDMDAFALQYPNLIHLRRELIEPRVLELFEDADLAQTFENEFGLSLDTRVYHVIQK